MKVTVTYNDKSVQVNLTDAQLETLGLKEKKKLTGYERLMRHEKYFVISAVGTVFPSTEDFDCADQERYAIGNYHDDKTLAESNARADTLMRRLRRFAAENGGIPSVDDWKKTSMYKYYIYAFYCDDHKVQPECAHMTASRDAFQIYFKSEEACKRAIEEFKDELIWYFTEYQAMLY